MILHRLDLRRFLGLPNGTFEFSPGINVIIGPNEAGKSTLRAAIRTVLYENPATTSVRIRDGLRTWGAEEPPELQLEFEINGGRFHLTKDFATRKVVLSDHLGRTWEQHKTVQERLVGALGFPSADLFDATAHIAQMELERIHITSIGKELGRIIGGGGEDVAAAGRKLDAHIRMLERGSKGAAVKEPGPVVAGERMVTSVRTEVEMLRRNAAEAERVRAELAGVAQSRGALAENLAAKKALLESNREMLQIEERLSALKREEAMWEQKVAGIADLTQRLTQLDRGLEEATSAGVPDEGAVKEARSVFERLHDRRRERAGLEDELTHPESVRAAPGRDWAAAAVGLGLLLVGLLGRRALGSMAWIAVAAGALAVTAGLWAAARGLQRSQLAAARRQERKQRAQTLDAEGAQLDTQLDALLEKLGSPSVGDAEARWNRYHDLAQERQQVAAFLAKLREGSDDEAISEHWKTARRDVFGLEDRLRSPEMASRRITPLQVQALEREVAELDQQLSQAQRREIKLAVDLERLTADSEQLATKEEQLLEADESLTALRRHLEVCKEAYSGLVEARRQAEVPVREIVERRAGEYLRTASGGRYTRLQVEEETLQLSVWSDDAGTWVEAAEPHLSRGTVDLVYLAARLALVSVLAEGKRPPLLFDDPFITFDDHRRAGAVTLLRELSREYQVFLFTYTRHYDGCADRLIELSDRTLPAATARPDPVRPAQPAPSVGPLWDLPPH